MKRLSFRGNNEQKLIGSGQIEESSNNSFDSNLLKELSGLLNEPVDSIKQDCYFSQIKKFMNSIGQVNVRFDVAEKKLEKILLNADTMNTAEVLLSPIYLSSCKKIVKENKIEGKYSALIDFPFGESSFQTKKQAVKECLKQDVKSITVTIPTMLILPENIKDFTKQSKKFGVMADVPTGVSFNATDMTDDQIKEAIKKIEKTKIDFITFMFGDSTPTFIIERMAFVKKLSSKKPINILGNIDRADIVKELVKLGVNLIYTPYADDISKEMIEAFGIKKVKLL